MSMIYECPTCHAPQPAGATACDKCGAEFDGAVPDDAILPAAAASSPGRGAAASSGTAAPNTAPDAVTLPPSPGSGPVITAPPPADSLPYQSPPVYQPPPPGYTPPAYAEPPAYQTAPPQTAGPLPRALLIALPILLVLVLGAVFLARSLNQSPVTPPVVVTAPGPPPPAPAAPVGSPTTLPGTTSAGAADSPAAQWLVGRWTARNTDFYVFNADGSGSQGTVAGHQAQASFQWSLVQNQLILYKDKQETLAFSTGPDDNTMFLRSESGKYVEYTRDKSHG